MEEYLKILEYLYRPIELGKKGLGKSLLNIFLGMGKEPEKPRKITAFPCLLRIYYINKLSGPYILNKDILVFSKEELKKIVGGLIANSGLSNIPENYLDEI